MRFCIYGLFLMFGVFPKGLTSEIQTHHTVMAAAGEEAHFSCQLTEPEDVVQVTWQKVLPDDDKNMATFTVDYGQIVNPDFRDKVAFKDAGLQNSSIVMRNVTDEDEGCCLCLFNTYTDGALRGETCLHLCELHEPVLQVRESNSTEESLVSCSVTARPAPTVTLTVTQQLCYLSHYNTVSVTNTNATVTVTTTAVLSGFRGDSTRVGCAGRVPSGPQKEGFVNIPEAKQTSADGFEENSGSNGGNRFRPAYVVCGAFGLVFIVLSLQFIMNRCEEKTQMVHSATEDIKVDQKPSVTEEEDLTMEAGELRTPSTKQENELRKQTSPKVDHECYTVELLDQDLSTCDQPREQPQEAEATATLTLCGRKDFIVHAKSN